MGRFKNQSANYGELMRFLLKDRANFSTDEEFNAFALAEVRRFINDLRSLNIELSLRPNYNGTPLSRLSSSEKFAEY